MATTTLDFTLVVKEGSNPGDSIQPAAELGNTTPGFILVVRDRSDPGDSIQPAAELENTTPGFIPVVKGGYDHVEDQVIPVAAGENDLSYSCTDYSVVCCSN